MGDSKLFGLFQDYAGDRGCVTGDDVLDILRELGIEAEERVIRQYLQHQWEEVDFDAVTTLLQQLSEEQVKSSAVHEEVEKKERIVYLPTTQWIWWKLSCGRRERGVVHRRKPLEAPSPRILLVLSSALSLVFTGVLILLVMSVLWVQNSTKRQAEFLDMTHLAFENVAGQHHLEALSRSGIEMADEVAVVGATVETQLEQEVAKERSRMSRSVVLIAKTIRNRLIASLTALKGRCTSVLAFSVSLDPNSFLSFQTVYNQGRDLTLGNCSSGRTIARLGQLCLTGETVEFFDNLLTTEVTFFRNIYAGKEILIGRFNPAGATPLQWITNSTVAPNCDILWTQACEAIFQLLSKSREASQEATIVLRQTKYLVAAVHLWEDLFIVAFGDRDTIVEQSKMELIETINHLNFHFERTTEIVLAIHDPVTNAVIPQATQFRFADGCYSQCRRWEASSTNVFAGFATKGFGYQITPDYRPEPVMGAYSYLGSAFDSVLLIERDIEELGARNANSLVEIMDSTNNRVAGSWRAHLIRYQGLPPVRLFDPTEECTAIEGCIFDNELGTIFRPDCVACRRRPDLDKLTVEYMTKKQTTGSESRDHVAEFALWSPSTAPFYADDYRSVSVLAIARPLVNWSCELLVTIDEDEILKPIYQKISLGVGAGVVILISAMLLLMFVSRNAMKKVEADWVHYRDLIERDKEEYSLTVRDVLPSYVAQQVLKGRVLFADTQAVALCVLEPETTALVEKWHPEDYRRYISYVFHLVDALTLLHDLYRVRRLGDTHFIIARMDEQRSAIAAPHCSCRLLEAVCSLLRLSAPNFAHFPLRTPALQQLFAGVSQLPNAEGRPDLTGVLRMPMYRVTMHFGSAAAVLIHSSTQPHFDLSGPNVALLWRLHSFTSLGSIVVTSAFKDAVESNLGGQGPRVEFSEGKKTLIRGQGATTTYDVLSFVVDLPRGLINDFGIKIAKRRVFYSRVVDTKENETDSMYSANFEPEA